MFKLKIPPPVYLLITAGLMWLLDQHWPVVSFIVDPWNKTGFCFIALGLVIDVWSLRLFFRSKTTLNPMNPENTKEIVSSGTYKISRNPMYLGLLLVLIGVAVFLGSLGPFLLLPLFILLMNKLQILPEEQVLEMKFGQPYLDYKNSVRRWL